MGENENVSYRNRMTGFGIDQTDKGNIPRADFMDRGNYIKVGDFSGT
jgi:hypothetical protein